MKLSTNCCIRNLRPPTNTNQQHYSGQAQLSYFSQMFGITALTPTAGLAALVAIVRTLLARPEEVRRTADDRVAVGNFYGDLVRGIVRVTIPLAVVMALLLAWQGVPSTFQGAVTVNTLDSAAELTGALNNVYPLVLKRLWLVAFGFGLLHGFGFASVLADLELPRDALLLSLVGFNLGVEVGQVVIVAAFVPLAFLMRRTWMYRRLVLMGGSLTIALLASIWMAERVFNFKLLPV